MDVEELRQRYKDGERDFSGIELRDADLRDVWLSQRIYRRDELILKKAKLINVNLNRAQLSKADLSEADLSGSNLTDATLRKANLANTNLSDTNLSCADLNSANLRNANLTNTNLNYTDLIGADLIGTNIDKAINVASHHLFLLDEYNNPHTELVTELRDLTRGLLNYHNSCGAYPYDIFLWDTASRGDFTFEKFLEAAGFLVEVDAIDLLEGRFYIEEFSFILQDIKQYIKNRKYYYCKLGGDFLYYDGDESKPILIGKTQLDDWIGICPVFDIERGGEDEFSGILDKTYKKVEYDALKSALRKFDESEIFSENFEWATEGIAWAIAKTRDNLLHNLLKYSNMLLLYKDYEELPGEGGFFGENYFEYKNDPPEEYDKIITLSNIVKNKFNDIKVYWVSHGDVHIYIVGKIDTGDWIGIYNKLIDV